MKRTTAPGSSGGQYVDDNPAMGIVGTLMVAADRNIIQEELCAPIEGAGLTLSGSDSAQLWKAMRKMVKEKGREVGELFSLPGLKAPVAYSDGAIDSYFPALCLTDFDTYSDIDETNYPDLVPYLRSVKQVFKEGAVGQLDSLSVTNWAIASNVVSLTIGNTTDNVSWLNALLEDKNLHGSYTGWRTVTLASAIGDVPAGTYAITEVDSVARTVKFSLAAANNSGAVTAAVEFYPHRIAGSTTTCRLYSMKGLTIHGQGDGNSYMVNGLRRRGYFQGHYHDLTRQLTWRTGTAAGANSTWYADNPGNPILSPITDGTNGTPRTGKETHGPMISAHIYMHAGRLL